MIKKVLAEIKFRWLLIRLKSRNADARLHSVWALGKFRDKRAVDPLVERLIDSELGVILAAKKELVEVGKLAVPNLIKALKKIKNEYIVETLGELRDKQAIQPLLECLPKTSWFVFDKLIDALKKSYATNAQIVNGYIIALSNSDSSVRHNAAEALGNSGDLKAIPPLLESLVDESEEDVLFFKVEALRKLGANDERIIDAYLKILLKVKSYPWAYKIRRESVEALGNLKAKKAVGLLFEMLKDGYGDREAIAEALGTIGDERSVVPLIKMLDDDNDHVKVAVIEALRKIGDNKAGESIFETIKKISPNGESIKEKIIESGMITIQELGFNLEESLRTQLELKLQESYSIRASLNSKNEYNNNDDYGDDSNYGGSSDRRGPWGSNPEDPVTGFNVDI